MTELKDVCRHIRSKNAGPFWVTFDLFFKDKAAYERHRDDPALTPSSIARLFGVSENLVRRTCIDRLDTVKISIPRRAPQGSVGERDMHGGQQYIPLLSLKLAGAKT